MFYAAIIRDPRFVRNVGNVVVEFGAAGRYRPLCGGRRSALSGASRTVWTDTIGWDQTASGLGYAQFFAQVRKTNKTLPRHERIRPLTGRKLRVVGT